MNLAPATKRPICPTCQRPQRTCICCWITPTDHAVQVLILQHPLEVDAAKGSARLLQLSLRHSRLAVGECFDREQLHALLYAPFPSQGQEVRIPILLYPETPHDQATPAAPAPAFDRTQLHSPSQLRLVILDGTWRKSRKMLYLNPLLQTLPRLPLTDVPQSRYLIRKAHKPDQLSTLEATCLALMQLEKSEEKCRPLLQAFDGFVAQQASYKRLA